MTAILNYKKEQIINIPAPHIVSDSFNPDIFCFPILKLKKRPFRFPSLSKPKWLASSLVPRLKLKKGLKLTKLNKLVIYRANYTAVNVPQR